MLMTRRTTARQVGDWLRAQGFSVKSVAEGDDVADGEVDLGDGMSVQVGEDYAIACRLTGQGDDLVLEQGNTQENLYRVAEDLRRLAVAPVLKTGVKSPFHGDRA